MLTNEQVTEEMIAKLAAPRYRSAEPIWSPTYDCLRQLAQLGSWQLEAVRVHDMNRLLAVLSAKQRLLVGLQRLERQLDPFRQQNADERRWVSDEARQRCAKLAAESEALLAQIVRQEVEANKKCTNTTMLPPIGCKRRTPRPWRAAVCRGRSYPTSATRPFLGQVGDDERERRIPGHDHARGRRRPDDRVGRLEHRHRATPETREALRSEVRRLTDELEVKNRELARKNRLADLGQMASHIAHEVRNNLVPVTLYLSLLRRRLSDDSGSLDILDKVGAGCIAMDATVNDLLNFASENNPQLHSFSLDKLADDVLGTLAPQLSAGHISTKTDIPRSLGVLADYGMLRRAVLISRSTPSTPCPTAEN